MALGFIGIAFLSFLSWFGLKAKMPTQHISIPKQPVGYIIDDFKQVLKNKRFLALTLGLPMVAMPTDVMDCAISSHIGGDS